MKQKKFSITYKDPLIVTLVAKTEHRLLAVWAIDCVDRVIHHFAERYPEDRRPQKAIVTLKAWIITGKFRMAEIRKASLDAHAAARSVGEDNAARSAARSAGQAVATAHVPTHAIGAANYALQAIYRATNSENTVAKERQWQYEQLIVLQKRAKKIQYKLVSSE